MSKLTISSYRSEDLVAVHNYYSNTTSFPPHIHDAYELLFLAKGDVTYTVEGKAYHLRKGSLVITKPLKVHSVTFQAPSEYERYDILFDADILSTDVCSLLPTKLDVLHFAGNAMIAEIFKKIDYYCNQLPQDSLHAVLTHLTEEILLNAFIASRDVQERTPYTANPLVNQAVKYIEQHLAEPLTVADVCTQLHISQSYLLHLFGQHLNISPKKYIISKRLAMAQMTLRTGARPTEVYKQCGFSDYSTFFRAYKNHFGHPPTTETDLQAIRAINS